jgi:anaerobic ribonucleoside-triphosphate reductase activating protein
MLPFDGGTTMAIDAILAQLKATHVRESLEGITLLGGEPFAHADAAGLLAEAAHRLGLSVMIFSGYTLEALRTNGDPSVAQLLERTDILVDGPYDREQPESERRWIGSTNQRIHFLSDRCDRYDPRWRQPNTLEIRLVDGELTINGFPAKHARSLWKPSGT